MWHRANPDPTPNQWSVPSRAADLGTYTNPGNQTPVTQAVTLTITPNATATWQAAVSTACGGDWMKVTPTTGSVQTTTAISMAVAIDARSLNPGSYFGLITLSSPDVGTESPVTATVQITVIEKPLVFVPGVMGSTLIDAGGGELWPALTASDAQQRSLNLYPGQPQTAVTAGDAIRYVGGISWFDATTVYGPLLEWLGNNGYREYQVNNNAARRTKAGCDVSGQKGNNPNLFVYAYDFRQSNVESAGA